MKLIIIKILILALPGGLLSQELSGLRERIIFSDSDTVRLGTVKIVPGSIKLFTTEDENIADSLFRSDPLNSLLILGNDFPFRKKEIIVRYRVFTSDPSLATSKKDTILVIPVSRDDSQADPYRHTYRQVDDSHWEGDGLLKNGSISRGMNFGNNQDLTVSSNLNLQLSGRLDDNINILASISDQNIPLQPDGYSMQIHEFDKISVQLYNDNLSLTAGDFDVESGSGKFLPLNKKGQGIQFSTAHQPGKGIFTGLTSSTSAAVSKGRYHRNSFQGIEGNQGPYKLKGTNNEIYIIVLAGSERVYVDGKLLTRGVDRDYTIDYNLAEINFTSGMPVTKDRRIVVEFEYSDRNYTRFMVSGTTVMSTKKGSYFFNIFSEHDARNQPLMQELRDHEKQLLSSIGDSLHRAWVPKIDSVEFRDDMVLYQLSDSIVDGISYMVYHHSTDPARAHYRLGFSYVGENRGNYTQVSSAANGRVFRWSAPVNGTPSGTYEPVTMLIAPGKQQVISMGGNSSISERIG